jgi:hypothetical protein
MPAERIYPMKTSYRALVATLGVLVLTLLFVPSSTALCGGIHQPVVMPNSWHLMPGGARLLQTEYPDHHDSDEGIVGFWHVKFVSKGSAGIPDYTEVDAGYAQWHSDGTEIMNSGGRSPLAGDFCLGVWQKVGDCKYKLNHFAASWDSTGSNLIGPANIQENVTLSAGGNQFSGTFTIDQYTEAGNKMPRVQGTITGTRITVNTPPSSIF